MNINIFKLHPSRLGPTTYSSRRARHGRWWCEKKRERKKTREIKAAVNYYLCQFMRKYATSHQHSRVQCCAQHSERHAHDTQNCLHHEEQFVNKFNALIINRHQPSAVTTTMLSTNVVCDNFIVFLPPSISQMLTNFDESKCAHRQRERGKSQSWTNWHMIFAILEAIIYNDMLFNALTNISEFTTLSLVHIIINYNSLTLIKGAFEWWLLADICRAYFLAICSCSPVTFVNKEGVERIHIAKFPLEAFDATFWPLILIRVWLRYGEKKVDDDDDCEGIRGNKKAENHGKKKYETEVVHVYGFSGTKWAFNCSEGRKMFQ